MKLSIISSLILLTISVFSQKCKFDHYEIDKMSEKVLSRIDLRATNGVNLSYYRNGDNLFINQSLVLKGEQNDTFEKGVTLKIKLNNDSIITMKSSYNSTPSTEVLADQIVTRYLLEYKCSKEIFKSIANNGFEVFSYKLKNDPITSEIRKKSIKKVKIGAKCILEQ